MISMSVIVAGARHRRRDAGESSSLPVGVPETATPRFHNGNTPAPSRGTGGSGRGCR
jgi:hypothetical protein